jgi:hypothetical protein
MAEAYRKIAEIKSNRRTIEGHENFQLSELELQLPC